ncbi:MAG: metallophosphoesterase family protein [Candidatus Cloacimonadota bacterium]|nr:metallophosphoesterase family protein [Candidatus Cloacimonadota bacterium]
MVAKIIVLSDSHKNQKLLRKSICNETSLTHIFHLGDNYEDLDDNIDLIQNKQIMKVPGIFHPGYINKKLPTILKTSIADWKFTLLHNLEDWTFEYSDLVLFGHIHKQQFFQKDEVSFLNPGHLKGDRSRSQPPGYAVLEVSNDKIDIKLKNIKGNVLTNHQVKRR